MPIACGMQICAKQVTRYALHEKDLQIQNVVDPQPSIQKRPSKSKTRIYHAQCGVQRRTTGMQGGAKEGEARREGPGGGGSMRRENNRPWKANRKTQRAVDKRFISRTTAAFFQAANHLTDASWSVKTLYKRSLSTKGRLSSWFQTARQESVAWRYSIYIEFRA